MPLVNEFSTDTYVGAFNFRVNIPDVAGDINQAFTQVSGVKSSSEKMEFMHGTDPYARKGVGRTTYDDLQLKRVYNGNDAFYSWRLEIEQGILTRRDVKIEMLRPDGSVARTMICREAWPSEWVLPEMDATGSNPGIETITLTVERVTNE